jgi:chondroitin AC lyase
VPTRGFTTFVGGGSDGQVGLAAMDYDRDGVRAHKTWFFLPDGWVALGAGIEGQIGDPLTTSINQCLLKSGVLLLRDGRVEALEDAQIKHGDLQGVHHDGAGYYLLHPQRTAVRAAPQSGTWTSIQERARETGTVTQDVFSLWIEHGPRPAEGGYAYRVVPNLPSDDLATYPSGSPVTVLANAPDLQAIAYPRRTSASLIQAVFFAPGRLDVGGPVVGTDTPCLLMLRETEQGILLSVADPTQTQEQVQIQLTGAYTAPGSTYDPAQGITLITVQLPAGDFAGQTVQVRLHAP